MGAPLTDGFRYVSIPFVLLPAGSYTIGGFAGASGPNPPDPFVIEADTITTASGVTFTGSRGGNSTELVFPPGDFIDLPPGYFGPNFQFTVPDSGSTVSLLGFVLLGLAGLRRKLSLGMKTSPKLLIALATAAAFSLAHPAKANLITNPGFETGNFTGWTRFGERSDVFGNVGGIDPHSGNFQAALHSSPEGDLQSIAQTLATTPGQSYTIDFWLANSVLTFVANTFAVTWGNLTILGLSQESFFPYKEYTFNVTATSASTALTFSFRQRFFLTDHSTWLLDDVSVNPVPDGGSTVSLVGFALLGLAALRRKLSC
jgi:hypothetical protein